MGDSPETVELRLAEGAPAEAITGPLVTAMGARAGLTVQQLDELGMAVELVLAAREEYPTTVRIRVGGAGLEVSVQPVPPDWAERRARLLGRLAGSVEVDGDRIGMRAGD